MNHKLFFLKLTHWRSCKQLFPIAEHILYRKPDTCCTQKHTQIEDAVHELCTDKHQHKCQNQISCGIQCQLYAVFFNYYTPLGEELLLQVASVLRDPVTTTDELIPSGETSSYRSNPLKLASFALSRRDPDYVPRARATQALEEARRSGAIPPELQSVQKALSIPDMSRVQIGSVLFANKPGDGSAREQAASCQRVLGGCANLCYEFATKRYRSNCVNWGMLPFTLAEGANFPGRPGDFLYVPQVREKVTRGDEEFPALLLTDSGIHALTLYLKNTTAEERELLLTGCLMNHYAAQNAAENRR